MFRDVEHTALMDVACSNATAVRNGGPVSLFDLLHTLQKNRKLIPSHSVYSINVERLLSQLNHPGRDE
jgi:transcriptional adapter 1